MLYLYRRNMNRKESDISFNNKNFCENKIDGTIHCTYTLVSYLTVRYKALVKFKQKKNLVCLMNLMIYQNRVN